MAYDSMTSLGDLDAIRKRPGMYVDSVVDDDPESNPAGLIQIFQEIVSNSADEALNGFGTEVSVTIHDDNSITVRDHGRGIPRSKSGKADDFDDVIRGFTKTHTSGKFSSDNYSTSGGLNGVGAKATCALSRWLKVSVDREDESYDVSFEQSTVTDKNLKKRKNKDTGTTVTFLPDDRIFSNIKWDYATLCGKINIMAYLNPGVSYTIEDEREDLEGGDHPTVTFVHENGILDMVTDMSSSDEYVGTDEPLRFEREFILDKSGKYVGPVDEVKSPADDSIKVTAEVALVWTDSYEEEFATYANGIPTHSGGDHLNAALAALYNITHEYAQIKKLLKRGQDFTQRDIRDGLVMSVSVGIPESILDFKGQTKDTLRVPGIRKPVEETVSEGFTRWLYDNPSKAKKLVEKVSLANKSREAADKAREIARLAKKKTSKSDRIEASEKLTDAARIDPKYRELYIVEGDSAGGSVVNGRSMIEINGKQYHNQGVLPLRGKIINPYNRSLDKVLKSEVTQTIIAAIGAGFLDTFDISKIKYHKIVILTDADKDGYHIRAQLLTLFWFLMPELLIQGHVYIAQPPLYRFTTYKKGKQVKAFALDAKEFYKMRDDHKGWVVTRMKGLGEMKAQELGETTLTRGNRVFKRVKVPSIEAAKASIKLLMAGESGGDGKAAKRRRDWIDQNVTFDDVSEEDAIIVENLVES